MNLIFNVWPDEGKDVELWLTKLEGEGTITQAAFEFDRETAEKKAAAINAEAPGVATVIGPFVLAEVDRIPAIESADAERSGLGSPHGRLQAIQRAAGR